MSYGLSFSNSSGVITIDEDFRGYPLQAVNLPVARLWQHKADLGHSPPTVSTTDFPKTGL